MYSLKEPTYKSRFYINHTYLAMLHGSGSLKTTIKSYVLVNQEYTCHAVYFWFTKKDRLMRVIF